MPFSFIKNFFQKRRLEMEALSDELDMDFYPLDESGLASNLSDFRLFSRGRRRRVKNLLVPRNPWMGSDIRIFDYEYTVGSGKHQHTPKQTVFLMQSDQINLPHVWMYPENFVNRIGTFLGQQDIDFEAFPQFSRQYIVKGNSEPWIRQSFSEDFLHFFTIEKYWTLEAMNDWFVFYPSNRRLRPPQIRDFYEKGLTICDILRRGYGGEMV